MNVIVILDFIDVIVPERPIKRPTLDFLLGKAENALFVVFVIFGGWQNSFFVNHKFRAKTSNTLIKLDSLVDISLFDLSFEGRGTLTWVS